MNGGHAGVQDQWGFCGFLIYSRDIIGRDHGERGMASSETT